jgi:hypothetical protein
VADPILGGKKIMIESPLIQEIVAEAEARARQRDLVGFLEARFGRLPAETVAMIESVWDEAKLAELVTWSAQCECLENFSRKLEA